MIEGQSDERGHMESFYNSTNEVAILRERIEELSRIRVGFSAHLGSSLYEATKDDQRFRWGRESLYDGIALCDAERERLLTRIEELESAVAVGEPSVGAEAPITVVEEEPERIWPDPAPEKEDVLEEAEVEQAVEQDVEDDVVVPVPEELPQTAEDEATVVAPEPDVAELVAEEALASEIEEEQASDSSSASDVREEAPFEQYDVVQPVAEEPAQQDDELAAGALVVEEEKPAEDCCPTCGSRIKQGDRFCMVCGTCLVAAEPTEPEPKPTPGACPNCGAPIDPSFKFCMSCGHRL